MSTTRVRQLLPCRSWCEEVTSSCPSVFANGSSFESTNCNLLNSTSCVNLEPYEDCYYGKGQNYKGAATLPEESGRTCLKWSSFLSDHLMAKYSWADPQENYCRNFPLGNAEEPFCLVKTVSKGKDIVAMEPCGLRPCDAIGCGAPPDVTFGNRSPVRNFYLPGETVFITCDTGYVLQTDQVRISCTQNGTWSKTDIRCSADYSLQLSNALLDEDRYSSKLPPGTGNINITFEAAVVEIIDADEKDEHMFGSVAFRLRWKDSRLSWTPAKYGDVTQLVLTTEDVWIPNIYLMRNGDAKFSTFPDAPVTVTSDGEVGWDIVDLLTTTCDLDPALFPFDTMSCPVCLGTTTRVERFNCPDPQDDSVPKDSMSYIENFMKCGDQMEEVVDQWNAKWTVSVQGGVFGRGCISVMFDRIPTFHSCTTLSPGTSLDYETGRPGFDSGSYPNKSKHAPRRCTLGKGTLHDFPHFTQGDRVSYGITILLSMVVSLVFITDVLPAKGSMPVVAVLIVVYMCLMGMFLIVTVIVIKISSRKGHLPPLMKKIFLRYLARVVLLGDLTKRHRGHKLVNEDYLEMVNATKTNTSKPETPKTQMEILLCLGDTVRDLGRAVNKLAMSGSSKTGAEERKSRRTIRTWLGS
ncbi:Carboxylesterase 5A [Branchiostoma belcheri]|nr:Carboxylesterase 5A [Branchiostoma belcheri]